MSTILDELKVSNTKRRFSLVVQGGGMRGVYSAGALACLDHYKLQNSFVSVTGCSAGALNAAYFLADQPGAVNVYTDLLSNKLFINLTRPSKKIDIDFMIDVALHQKYPIDIDKLKTAKPKFDIILTNADNGKKTILTQHHGFTKIYEEFRATTALPVLYDKKILLQEKYYIDGGVSDLIPVDVAVEEHKPTDVIVIMSRPLNFYTKKSIFRPSIKRLVKRAAKYQSAAVREMLPTNEQVLKANISAISSGSYKGATIHLIAPTKEIGVSLTSTDSAKLESAAEDGWRDTESFLHTEYFAEPANNEQTSEELIEATETKPVISDESIRYLEEISDKKS